MDDGDLNFGTSKARNARQGRRAAATTPNVDLEQDEDMNASAKPAGSSGPTDRPSKAVSGWGDEAPKKPRSRQLGEGLENVEDERLRPNSPHKEGDDGSDTDIPVIPELEDQAEEDLSTRIASAPNVAVNRVATYRELDTDLQRQAAFQVLDNEIDLKLLTKSLSPMEDLVEEDRPWDWDRLFTEVSSELTTAWEKKNTEVAEGEQPAEA